MPDGHIKPAPLFDFGMAFGGNIYARFDPPKLFFHSGQDVLSFLKKERDPSEWDVWGIPDCLMFSQADFKSFFDEAATFYTVDELDVMKYALCETVLDFPAFFKHLDPIQITKLQPTTLM